MSYSLLEVVRDGPLTTARWTHHLVKFGTHLLVSVGLRILPLHLGWVWAAILGGPTLWLLLAVREHFWPTDLQPLTRWQHIADWMTDCALATVPVAGALVLTRAWVASVLVFVACAVAYAAGHRDARP